LAHSKLKRDFPIALPKPFARARLDRYDAQVRLIT
jgi:hypothetical protein